MVISKTHQKLAHELVAATAKEMAGCWYEEAAHDNDFFHFYPKQDLFVKKEWKRFVEAARKTLALLLGDPMTPEWQKEQISDALIKHASLPGNIDKRVAAKMIAGGDAPSMYNITNPEKLRMN
jgi:hypothetical protein